MKAKLLELILRRMGSKLDDVRSCDSEEVLEFLADDLEYYLSELKVLLSDVLL